MGQCLLLDDVRRDLFIGSRMFHALVLRQWINQHLVLQRASRLVHSDVSSSCVMAKLSFLRRASLFASAQDLKTRAFGASSQCQYRPMVGHVDAPRRSLDISQCHPGRSRATKSSSAYAVSRVLADAGCCLIPFRIRSDVDARSSSPAAWSVLSPTPPSIL